MRRDGRANRVLILQPALPHYRVPFFNALERLRPDRWTFSLALGPTDLTSPRLLLGPIDPESLRFPVEEVRRLRLPGPFTYQTAWLAAGRADLVVAEHALRDVAYSASLLHRLHGVRFAWWGHGRDRSIERPSLAKAIAERAKLALARRADGYFAYTEGVRQELVARGLQPDRVFSLGNTIDIDGERSAHESVAARRAAFRRDFGVAIGPVLLFVGRMTENKRIPFLLEAFNRLRSLRPDARLFLVGAGAEGLGVAAHPGVRWFGALEKTDDLAPIYAASDLLAFPGAVGLGPLQAMCHDLPTLAVDSAVHMPEIEYLTPANSVTLPASTRPDDYARAVCALVDEPGRLEALRSGAWPSIRHLTINRMALNFVRGVDTLLGAASDP